MQALFRSLLFSDVDLDNAIERLRAPALHVATEGGAEQSTAQVGAHALLEDLTKL